MISARPFEWSPLRKLFQPLIEASMNPCTAWGLSAIIFFETIKTCEYVE